MSSMPDDVRARLAARFGEIVPAEGDLDPDGVLVPVDQHVAFARFLKDDLGFTLYVTVVASHWPADPKEGRDQETWQVATVLRRPTKGDSPEVWWRVETTAGAVPSLFPVFAGADWQEREQYDLVGVLFTGHPDMRRLMMPEDWDGHPLRKDYAIDTAHPPWR